LVVPQPQPAPGGNQLLGHLARDCVVRHDGIADGPAECHLCVASHTFHA